MEQISVRKTLDGVVTELSEDNTTNRRDLSIGTQSPSTVLYTITNADFVEIAYRSRADILVPSPEGLTVGEIVGIAIGSLAGFGIIVAIIVLCWIYRIKVKRNLRMVIDKCC